MKERAKERTVDLSQLFLHSSILWRACICKYGNHRFISVRPPPPGTALKHHNFLTLRWGSEGSDRLGRQLHPENSLGLHDRRAAQKRDDN